jgi:myo-inositol-1(or 4)-monophosphatase
MHPFINIAVKAARAGANVIMKGYARPDLVHISSKGARDFVTDVDIKAEQTIIYILRESYPDHSILSEESGLSQQNDYQWVIDPLDGTRNFINGFPHFAVSIALKYKNRLEHAVIYDPIRNDLFTASRGENAQKNNCLIRVNSKSTLENALVATSIPYRAMKQHQQAYESSLHAMTDICPSIRRTGSAALDLAYVASGQLDGFWELGLHPWDIAAGILLVKEAGGMLCDFQGGENYFEQGGILAGNPKIIKDLLKYIKPFFEKEKMTATDTE